MGYLETLQELLFNPQLYSLDGLQPTNIITSLSVAALCGMVIFLVYRFFHRGVLYSAAFNILNVMICVTTAFIIITIGTNLVLTLGMVGALSVVRFRAAVKDPLDVGFLFWGVAAGLTAGASLHMPALIGTAFIAVIYIVLTYARLDKRAFLLITRYEAVAEDAVAAFLKKTRHKLKNKTMEGSFTELTVEVKVRKNDVSFAEPLRGTEGVVSAVLVEYTGDYA